MFQGLVSSIKVL